MLSGLACTVWGAIAGVLFMDWRWRLRWEQFMAQTGTKLDRVDSLLNEATRVLERAKVRSASGEAP